MNNIVAFLCMLKIKLSTFIMKFVLITINEYDE